MSVILFTRGGGKTALLLTGSNTFFFYISYLIRRKVISVLPFISVIEETLQVQN